MLDRKRSALMLSESPEILLPLPKKYLKKTARFLLERYCFLRLKVRKNPCKLILILAHTRSGSTLLQHLLITNSEIAGFGENRMGYESIEDIQKLVCNIHWHLRRIRMPEMYVVDKIVHHSAIAVSSRLLQSERVFTIFLVRDPQSSILSISQGKKESETLSTNYYIDMLSKLEAYGKLIRDKERGLFLTYGQILYQTESVLKTLQHFLELRHSLTEKYNLLPTTGASLFGDWSENIKAGRIIRTQKNRKVEISKKSLEPAQYAHSHCCSLLSEYCTTIESYQ